MQVKANPEDPATVAIVTLILYPAGSAMFSGNSQLRVAAVADAVTAVKVYSLIKVLLVAVALVDPLLIKIRKVPAVDVAVVVLDLTTNELTKLPSVASAVNTVATVPVPSRAVFAAVIVDHSILGAAVKTGTVFCAINRIL